MDPEAFASEAMGAYIELQLCWKLPELALQNGNLASLGISRAEVRLNAQLPVRLVGDGVESL